MLPTIPKTRAVTLLAAVALLLLTIHVFYSQTSASSESSLTGHDDLHTVPQPLSPIPCRNLPKADDIAVVLRTGATEIQDKLPAHLETTFKCYNDPIIFSDYEETINGRPVHDVLRSMPPSIKDDHPDFEIYRRLQKEGRAGLRPEELSGAASYEGSKSGKLDKAGWKLDKWKFLPMMKETLRLQPNKNWYVFLETDSYLVWSNLIQWVQKLDPSKALYYGSENQIGPDIYAHGGSVVVMSRLAVEKAAEIYTQKEDEWHKLTAGHWAGDCVLGIALRKAGIPLTWAWPMLQGGHPEKMDFTESKGKKLWCRPALSYHHFSSPELRRMWNFEQSWIQSRFQVASDEQRVPWRGDTTDILHHRDVFRKFIFPNITSGWMEWNNLSPDLIVANNDNYDACYHLCENSADCLQFSVGPEGCAIGTKYVTLGERWADYRSYWVPDRTRKWMDNLDQCNGNEGWLLT